MKVIIDFKEVETAPGRMLIDVLREQGVEVPSMCYLEGVEHFTSCMVCVVKDSHNGKLLPSCSMAVEEGMDIITMDEEIREARKTSLELLLSEHVGDCEAPCQVTCPAHMDIPLMNRHLARGEFAEALRVVKKDIALPAVFGRICPAPCEGACRRKDMDGAVSICLLKRYAGDDDLQLEKSWQPPVETASGKRVAVIGAGPAGLAAAWHLSLKGHSCILLDRNAKPGGSMRKEVPEEVLPVEVLDREIHQVLSLGIELQPGKEVGPDEFPELCKEYDAVVIATGKDASGADRWDIPVKENKVMTTTGTYQVGDRNVFVVGSALKPARMAIRALGQGKEVAFSVDQFLRREEVRGEEFVFNSRFGKLVKEEYAEYLKESVEGNRLEPLDLSAGFSAEEVKKEAARCLHCDCRDMLSCKLRIYANAYQAQQRRFRSEERERIRKMDQHDLVLYEPSKCIKCGICVRLTEKHGEKFGFTFIGRGFEVEVEVPFGESLGKGLEKVAEEVAAACPTGAIAVRGK
jgi:NADPH-dependent glutamate synthase beta subunit-like oxidoreductase/ferredoxin